MNTKMSAKDISYIALFATLISVSGYIFIPLPFSTVPVTAQTLAVMLAGSLMTPGKSAFCIMVFLLMGAAGLPVFSGGASGFGYIVGKTGGYLMGFLAGAVVISLIRGRNAGFCRSFIANAIGGILVVYTFGALWLSFITKMSLLNSVIYGVLPFIPGDILKASAASVLAARLEKASPFYLRTPKSN